MLSIFLQPSVVALGNPARLCPPAPTSGTSKEVPVLPPQPAFAGHSATGTRETQWCAYGGYYEKFDTIYYIPTNGIKFTTAPTATSMFFYKPDQFQH